jgi:hypothetical protein
MKYVRPTYEALLAEGMVLTNQAAFWRRDLHARIGYLNESLHYGFDYEWFLRVLRDGEEALHLPYCLGALRYHDATKTSLSQAMFDTEYASILAGRTLPEWKKSIYRARRLLLTLGNGEFGYVFRGIARRASRSIR